MAVGVAGGRYEDRRVEEIVAARGGGAEEANTPDASRLVAPVTRMLWQHVFEMPYFILKIADPCRQSETLRERNFSWKRW